MIGLRKRGLSPIIATVLLISIALVLAVIVFLWARSFVDETIEKDGQLVDLVCEDVYFLAEAHSGQLFIENTGNVPIYAIEMRIKGEGEIAKAELPSGGGTIGTGETMAFDLPSEATSGKTVIAVPILLGETSEEKVPHICDIKYGVETVVE